MLSGSNVDSSGSLTGSLDYGLNYVACHFKQLRLPLPTLSQFKDSLASSLTTTGLELGSSSGYIWCDSTS